MVSLFFATANDRNVVFVRSISCNTNYRFSGKVPAGSDTAEEQNSRQMKTKQPDSHRFPSSRKRGPSSLVAPLFCLGDFHDELCP